MNAAVPAQEFWRRRLSVPSYGVGEAARYADISSQTVRNWQRLGNRPAPLGARERGKSLSYLQLIELAVVATARSAGVKLPAIRRAREFMVSKLSAEYPFAEYRFKTDGKRLWIDYADELLEVSGMGQLTWSKIIGRLHEFEYDEHAGLVNAWHVAGRASHVVIDPRIQFGKPSVRGIATWVIAARAETGQDRASIAKDFGVPKSVIAEALSFERQQHGSAKAWSH